MKARTGIWGVIVLGVLFLVTSNAFAQVVDISGYFEPQYMGLELQGSWMQLQSNKLRVDLNSGLTEHIRFAANVNFITYHGRKDWNILDFLPKRVTAGVPDVLTDAFTYLYRDSLYLDNAYLFIHFPLADVTIGRQQISLGTGYAWNPTDLFNTKMLTDPTYEQPGHNALRADVPLGGDVTVTLLFQPERTLKRSGALLRLKGRAGHFDFSLLAAQKDWTFSDYQPLYQFGAPVSVPEKRQMLGADMAGEVLGLGVWAEGAYNIMERSADFNEWLVGMDYTWQNGFYLMGEFYHNSRLPKDYRQVTLSHWLQFISAQIKTISRDQLYLYASYPLTDLLTISLSTVYSFSDQSAGFIPMLQYSLFENLDLTAISQFYLGREGTAFADNLGNGGLVRLRYYF